MAKQILRRKWVWIRHTHRKPASSTAHQALTWNPQGKRKRGRPRNSWRRDTEAELKQQGTNWCGMTRAAQNRVRWRGVVDGLCSTCIRLCMKCPLTRVSASFSCCLSSLLSDRLVGLVVKASASRAGGPGFESR